MRRHCVSVMLSGECDDLLKRICRRLHQKLVEGAILRVGFHYYLTAKDTVAVFDVWRAVVDYIAKNESIAEILKIYADVHFLGDGDLYTRYKL